MIVAADARRIPLPDESVQCVVTSPPYWGLRKYKGEQELIWGGREDCKHQFQGEDISDVREESITGKSRTTERFYGEESRKFNGNHQKHFQTHTYACGAWRGAYGLEPTVEMYVAHTVEILREIRRVLRKDGVVFWNIGDSYAGSWGNYSAQNRGYGKQREIVSGSRINNAAYDEDSTQWMPPTARTENGLKPKDLCLIPERVALAAQADGWWVRSRITWAKPNPMPESVTDRPTDATELIWLFAKSERYFWDAEAVREPGESGPSDIKKMVEKLPRIGGKTLTADDPLYKANMNTNIGKMRGVGDPGTRNLRNIWKFPTQPYSGAHFATFPEELPRKCILAATSAHGACVKCGAPWKRIVEHSIAVHPNRWSKEPDAKQFNSDGNVYSDGGTLGVAHKSKTVGWEPTCKCDCAETQPCLVLDPFGGSGTTGRVAVELNRRAVLLDLAYTHEYRELADKRTTNVQRNLL